MAFFSVSRDPGGEAPLTDTHCPARRHLHHPLRSFPPGRCLGLLAALLLIPLVSAAQGPADAPGTIHGTVVAAETRQPLQSANVAVRAAADSTIVAGQLTASGGRFRVAGLRPGRYLLEVSYIGYEPHSRAVTITPAEPSVDLGTIDLASSAIALEGLTVEAERSTVVMAPDRTIYSTREMPVAAGGMATDVLASVPELEVDLDGSVSLRGANPRIFLNGRPAPMEGEALSVFLQQFPADRIDRIEVIANPSARFEAEGAGGIVNIVLKRDAELGLSGSVFLNGGTRGDAGGGGRLTYQRGRITLFGGSFLRFSQRNSTSYDLRQNLATEPVTFLEQDAWSARDGWSGNVDLTAELKTGERSTLWSEMRVYRSGFESDGVTDYTHMDAERDPTLRYARASDDESVRLSSDLAVGFTHVFQPRRHEFSVEMEYETGGEDEYERVRRRTLTLEGEDAGLPVELTTDAADERERELTFEADYTRPWGEAGQIEVGYRGTLEDTDNDRLLQVFPTAEGQTPIASTERGYAFREVFHSVYLTAARTMGDLGVQAGLRAERANTTLDLPAGGGTFVNDYSSLFPSANLSYDLGSGRQVRLSYSRRIRRPSPRVMNPIDLSTDPLNRRVGNPEIDPQYTHSLSLATSWNGPAGTLSLSPYYRATAGDWTQVKTVDAAGVSTVTWENLASVETYGTSLRASLRPIGGVSGFASLSGYREVRDASNLALDYSGSAMRWSARGNVTARLTPSLNLQGMVYYTPPRDVPQGRVSSSLRTNFGLRQQFWDDRASLNLTVTDPFDLSRSSFETRDPTHIQVGRSRESARRAVLSFSYTFGRPPRDGRDRGQQEMEEEQPEQIIR